MEHFTVFSPHQQKKKKSSTHCHNAAHMPPTSRPPLLRDHRHHWVPAKFSNSTFFFSMQGIAAIAAEQDPVLQLFAELETSFSSSQFKLTRDWNSLTLPQIFSCLYCSEEYILPASLKRGQLNSLWAVRAPHIHNHQSLQVRGLPAPFPPYQKNLCSVAILNLAIRGR